MGWPELYDEMCAVAGRGLFRGFSADDLGGIGVGFSLFDMPALASLACRVVAEEAALRRPVSVAITAPTPAPTATIAPAVAVSPMPPIANRAADTPDERAFDVPIRLTMATTRA
ncbi:MAG TPA: hypothetical protein VFW02_08225 [Candidatus Limnocylindrales bacterium]|nr:hypothetical protein [Candidatus Limnocylindrales bacterium]